MIMDFIVNPQVGREAAGQRRDFLGRRQQRGSGHGCVVGGRGDREPRGVSGRRHRAPPQRGPRRRALETRRGTEVNQPRNLQDD